MLTDSYIRYIADLRRYSPRTVQIYTDVLKRYFDFSCESVDDDSIVASMNLTAVRNYEVWLMDDCGLDARTVSLHLSVLSGFARYLMGLSLIGTNPVKAVRKPRQKKRLPSFIQAGQMSEYLDKTSPDGSEENLSLIFGGDKVSIEFYKKRLARLVVSLLYGTGMRRAELISLNVSSFSASRKTLRVIGKGNKEREIPLPASLCEELLLYLQSVEKLFSRERANDEPLLLTASGRRLYPSAVERMTSEELSKTGVPGRKSPHVLRHSLATALLDEGADIASIKELLGHSSLAATQVYTHNTAEKLRKVYVNAHPRAKRGGKNGDQNPDP